MTSYPNRSKALRYSVRMRNGLARQFSNKDAAMQCARGEAADGWPTTVRDMWSDTIIWRAA